MSAKTFRRWQHFDAMEPIGELRADYRAASIVQMIGNVNRGKDTPPLKLEECLLRYDVTRPAEGESRETPKRKQTWQEQEKIFLMWAATAAAKS